ncbi:sulfonate transport system permease protein [Silvimonas terrae]|uniref:Sulfonate transport system permease protein n=1 Tax=Silvimonas terrae TaxID=300266 RepID=A0A840RDR9_9NEIS|nr:ABC transporter permease [Silvimonas terrae]MBB5191639.1 sulfonate transport system permease protein [Silvimonas terrae]
MTTPPRYLHPAAIPPALRGWVLPVLIVFLWWAGYASGRITSPLFVSPGKVVDSALELIRTGTLWQQLGASLARDLAGFAAGALAGLTLGVLLGLSRLAENIFNPTLNAFKQVSIFAWVPLISLWFGLGDLAKVAFIGLAAFWPAFINTLSGVRGVPKELVEVARVLGFGRLQLVRRVILPAALPAIFSGIYLALIYAWLATLGSEYLLTAGVGIGNLLTDGQEQFRMDNVLLGVILVGLIGFGFTALAGGLERYLTRWQRR